MQSRQSSENGDLIRRMRGGDEEALRLLVAQHGEPTLARIRTRLHPGLRSKIDAEDVLQEVYLVVARRASTSEEDNVGAFVVWLQRIVDFKVNEAMRSYLDVSRRDVRRARARGARPNTSRYAGALPSPSQVAKGTELGERAQRALQRPPDDYRTVLHLSQVEDTDLREIAVLLSRSYEAVKKLCGRAVTRFKVLLNEEGRA